MNQRGQTEMIGLVVIVILITLGLLFLAQFALNEKPEKKIFTRKELAYSGMSAILKTSVRPEECGTFQPQLEIILQDCALYGDSSNSIYQCQREGQIEESCAFFQTTVKELLDATVKKWGKKYWFESRIIRVQGGNPDPLITFSSNNNPDIPECQGERDSSGLFPLRIGDAGLIESELYVCD